MAHGRDPAQDAPSSGAAGTTLVVGGGRIGLGVAGALASRGRDVTYVGDEPDLGQDLADVRIVSGDLGDAEAIRQTIADVGAVAVAVVVGADSESFLVAHVLRGELGGTPIVATVDHADRQCAFEALDVESVETGQALATAVSDRLPEPSGSTRRRHRL